MDLRALHLCAGAGGGILGGLLVGHLPVCAVEIDHYCQRVLIQRQRDGLLPPFPIWDDCRTFDGSPWHGRVDVIHAGFPCQPFSLAGLKRGEQDERNLWPDIDRILGEVRPRYIFLENVPALAASRYFGTILGQLTHRGYDSVWTIIGADDVGAAHRRKRLWILATDPERHAGGLHPGGREWPGRGTHTSVAGDDGKTADVPHAPRQQVGPAGQPRQYQHVGHADGQRCQEQRQCVPAAERLCCSQRPGWWQFEPDVGRVAPGIAFRVDKLRALGNAQVPLCAAVAWRVLSAALGEGH